MADRLFGGGGLLSDANERVSENQGGRSGLLVLGSSDRVNKGILRKSVAEAISRDAYDKKPPQFSKDNWSRLHPPRQQWREGQLDQARQTLSAMHS